MNLTPQQEVLKQQLIEGTLYELVYPGLDEVRVNIQDDNTWLQFTNVDGKHHYQIKEYPTKVVGAALVKYNYRLRAHSNGEIIRNQPDQSYLEKDYWPFALANPLQGIVLFGYQQAINGLLRRLSIFGGNEKQYGPSLFSFSGQAITLIAFEVEIMHETVQVSGDGTTTAQADGQILINVTHGDAPFEYSVDGQNWQDTNVFSGLASGEYFIMVRAKDLVAIGAPMRYRTVTVGTIETEAS